MTGCVGSGLSPVSDRANPVGWPAKALTSVGRAGALSGVPVLRETGRVAYAAGDALESPALLIEALATFRPEKAGDAGSKLVVGVGGMVTAVTKFPTLVFASRNVDLGVDAPLINQALAYLDAQATKDGTDRIFPAGTTVRAEGQGLVWIIPGEGEVTQVAEESLPFDYFCRLFHQPYIAQERSYGFVVPQAVVWEKASPGRAGAAMHEFYHQHVEIRHWLHGWAPLYWIGYYVAFPFQGYNDHWAEAAWKDGAYRVDGALRGWRPKR
jgi:hypothetical protein